MLISIIIVGKGLIMKVSARILSAHVMGNNEYHWNGVINYKLRRGVTCHPPSPPYVQDWLLPICI